MASFKKTRKMIVIAYAEKLLTDEEFLFLYEANKPVDLELPYYEYEEFNLENITEAKCEAKFYLKEETSSILLMCFNYHPHLSAPSKCLRPTRGTLYPSQACLSMSLQ